VEVPVQQQAAAPPQAAPVPFATQTQVSAVAPPIVEQPQAQGAPTGKYHVQVAAVRSRSEAYALSVRLLSQHASELGSRKPEVDQTVIGSMGTFYRVKVGPYASAEESQQLCGSLRASGFDCLITTQ
jgi:cell division septation protein DedD